MTQVGDIITVNGREERVIEVEMILRDGKPFYVALRSEPIERATAGPYDPDPDAAKEYPGE